VNHRQPTTAGCRLTAPRKLGAYALIHYSTEYTDVILLTTILQY